MDNRTHYMIRDADGTMICFYCGKSDSTIRFRDPDTEPTHQHCVAFPR